MTARDLAKAMNVSERTAYGYLAEKYRVPIHRAVQFCRLTGRSLKDVRPDIFLMGFRVIDETSRNLHGDK